MSNAAVKQKAERDGRQAQFSIPKTSEPDTKLGGNVAKKLEKSISEKEKIVSNFTGKTVNSEFFKRLEGKVGKLSESLADAEELAEAKTKGNIPPRELLNDAILYGVAIPAGLCVLSSALYSFITISVPPAQFVVNFFYGGMIANVLIGVIKALGREISNRKEIQAAESKRHTVYEKMRDRANSIVYDINSEIGRNSDKAYNVQLRQFAFAAEHVQNSVYQIIYTQYKPAGVRPFTEELPEVKDVAEAHALNRALNNMLWMSKSLA